MSPKKLLCIIFGFLLILLRATPVLAQCTTLGQTPATAFPVCGSSTFTQKSVPLCTNGNIPANCTSGSGGLTDVNPYWYKFTCYTSGTLGLTITPRNLGDDYDWQIFDVTGHDLSEVYTNLSLLVASNWSGLHGVTGTSSTATSLVECGSLNNFNPPIFSKMPALIQGHHYLLLISHFEGNSQSGYNLSFTGGTAVITDTVVPALKKVQDVCNGSNIRVIFNKKMQCSSLAANGSDFTITPGGAHVISAVGNSCSTGFDMDTVQLTLSGNLPPGPYTLTVVKGTDGNTVLDDCGTELAGGISFPLKIVPPGPTPMDSLTPVGCAPDVIQLVFSKQIVCSSIAANGSDFAVSGSGPVTVTSVNGLCDGNGKSNVILIHLSGPIQTAGNYQVKLVTGSDGNSIIDECGFETPPGAVLSFSTADTVLADFLDQVHMGCKTDTVDYFFISKDGVNQWTWVFDGTDTSHLQNPIEMYPVFGSKITTLIASNGVCSDTASKTIALDNEIKAAFEAPNIICPKDTAGIRNFTTGLHIVSWDWDFGDGTSSTDQFPEAHSYPIVGAERKYNITLVIHDSLGCISRTYQQIDVLKSCYIAVPSAFTPNGDGLNDYLYPLNAYKADKMEFRVYNRWGQVVFISRDWQTKWDGTVGGHAEPAGTFVWTLSYVDRDTGKAMFQKGTTILIR